MSLEQEDKRFLDLLLESMPLTEPAQELLERLPDRFSCYGDDLSQGIQVRDEDDSPLFELESAFFLGELTDKRVLVIQDYSEKDETVQVYYRKRGTE